MIRLYYARTLRENLDNRGGLPREILGTLERHFPKVHREVAHRSECGELR